MQGVRVRFLVGELRSHMPRGQKNQNIKQKQYYNKFNKDFKNGPHRGLPAGAVVGSPPANAGDAGSGPGLGGSYMPLERLGP